MYYCYGAIAVPDARQASEHRSLEVGMGNRLDTSPLERDHRRQVGDRNSRAPTQFPRLLALEVPPMS